MVDMAVMRTSWMDRIAVVQEVGSTGPEVVGVVASVPSGSSSRSVGSCAAEHEMVP